MPKLLKKLLASSTKRFAPRPPGDDIDLLTSPPPKSPVNPQPSQPDTELDVLAEQVIQRLQQKGIIGNDLGKQELIDMIRSGGSVGEDSTRDAQAGLKPEIQKGRRSGKAKLKKARTLLSGMAVSEDPPSRRTGDDGQKVLAAITGSIVLHLQAGGLRGQYPDEILRHCLILLETQRDELKDAVAYMQHGRYPALRTLQQVYDRILLGLSELENLTGSDAKQELGTLTQLLEQGPDYLIDTFLIELIVHHAEILDSTLAAQIRDIYDTAVKQPGDLGTFGTAAERIVAYAGAIPSEDLDDDLGKNAYRTIGKLVKQLKLRVDSEEQAGAAMNNTVSAAPPDDNLQALAASALESRFGTGPVPGSTTPALSASSVVTPASPLPKSRPTDREPPPSPASPSTSSLDSISLYEYRNQILTSSALDLVMRQEALAIADSSGQYAGEVSWDDLRKAWIPKNVVKARQKDLADGELPDLNPANHQIKAEDEFGNKIGWTDRGEMFYEDEDPKFEV